ncbi:MAG: hypothetical protein CVU38_12630 [Chloroflexi bacterium HGW-Chloroflexi-1]|nr:MAG: hypothetical protein CVU38_12630 [Chloroflexi bacterium HGW-Chloroflexi-1]
MELFEDDDEGYLQWVETNPEGFVLNSERHPSARYLLLHRAICGTICTRKRTNYTTTGYIKVCASNKKELEAWAMPETGGRFTAYHLCNP